MASGASSSQGHPTRLLTQQDRLARSYEEEVYPLLGQRLADLLVKGLALPAKAHVLQIGCGLGATPSDLLAALDADARLIIVESSTALLDRVRASLDTDKLGKRVFFRAHQLDARLPFAENGYDLVLANLGLAELASPDTSIADLVRVVKPGGVLRLATPLSGTWGEFLDVYSDILVRLRRHEMVEALAAYRRRFPESEALAARLEKSGLHEVAVETIHWELVFRSGREFFYSPVIEQGPLARWKSIAGKGAQVQDIFLAVKEAIDTYFSAGAFGVGINAGMFSGTKS